MRKILNVILSMVLIMVMLSGCANNDSTQKNEDVLRVGIDLKYYPFMYIDDQGNPAGLEVDIAKAFGDYIGKEVEIINTDFTMLIPALDTGNVDIVISDMSLNESRLQKVDFSIPYRYGRTLALVNKDFAMANDITDTMAEEDFFSIPNARFVGLAGTISVTVPQQFGVPVTEVTEIASGIMEVTKGSADILIGANTIRGDHAANKDTTIIYNGILEYSSSCFAVKKGNTQLIEQANAFIQSMYEEDGFYQKAGNKYDDIIGEFLKDDSLGLEYIIYPPQKG